MHLVEEKSCAPVYPDFEDHFSYGEIVDNVTGEPIIYKDSYLRKIRKFIEEYSNYLVIERIRKRSC
jgi:hypothetical protein